MSETTNLELTQPVYNPTPDQAQSQDKPFVCNPGDKECVSRLVQAFSDCD